MVTAHIGYFVPLIKIADFLRAGVEVRRVILRLRNQCLRNLPRLRSFWQVSNFQSGISTDHQYRVL